MPDDAPLPRLKRSVVRERLDEAKDAYVESAMGKGESWVKKLLSGYSGVLIDDIPKLMDALNLKIVPKQTQTVDREVLKGLRAIARSELSRQLDSDEDEEP